MTDPLAFDPALGRIRDACDSASPKPSRIRLSSLPTHGEDVEALDWLDRHIEDLWDQTPEHYWLSRIRKSFSVRIDQEVVEALREYLFAEQIDDPAERGAELSVARGKAEAVLSRISQEERDG